MPDVASILALALAGFCGAAHAGTTQPAEVTATAPATLCRSADRSDGTRPVMVLHAFRTSDDAASPTSRISVTADTGEATLIGLFPAGSLGPDAEARRFFLPGGDDTRCWSFRLTGAGTALMSLDRFEPQD